MESFGERLKAARERKGLMQRDVAAALDCAPTSLTNWERDKVQPSLEVLERLCEVLEANPLDMLDRQYSYSDIVNISMKPTYERSYQEMVALNFSAKVLLKLMPEELQRKKCEDNMRTAEFIRNTNVVERFGGMLEGKDLKALQDEYDASGGADADILFAYHALTPKCKVAFIGVLLGLLGDEDNIQPLVPNMEKAVIFTGKKMLREVKTERHPDEAGEVE